MDTTDIQKTLCEICFSEFYNTNKLVRTCSKTCSYKLRNKTRHTMKHESVDKLCAVCEKTFQDCSKKKLVTKCQKCIYAAMVEKRNQSGSYQQSDESKQRQSSLMKKIHKEKNFFTEQGIKTLSEKIKARWATDSYRSQVKLNNIEKYGVDHWTKTDAARLKLSERAKKYKASEETKAKLRISAAKRIREGRNTHPFHGRGGYRLDIDLYVRSRWEANFARYLNFTNQKFEYEKTSFTLLDGRTYTPDFKTGNVFYEVKGWWTSSAKEKFNSFREEYPDIEVQIVDELRYSQIQEQYAKLIPNWEYNK